MAPHVAFVWLGVPSTRATDWLRRFSFVVSALVALIAADGRVLPSLHQAPDAAINRSGSHRPVDVTVQVQSGRGAESSTYRLDVHLSSLTPKGARLYSPSGEYSGRIGEELQLSLGAGRYLFILSSPGNVRVVREVEVHEPMAVGFRLDPAVRRVVKVVVDEGEERRPLMAATVLLSDPNADFDQAQLPHGRSTDESGEAAFDETPGGPLLVRIFAPGFQPYRAVAEGDLLVRLEPASTLEVSVVDDNRPVPAAEVVLSGASLWPPQSVMTRDDGVIRITGLGSGRYSLFARKGSKISKLNDELVISGEAGTTRVELELGSGFFVRAQVVSESDDRPLSGAKVSVGSAGLGQFRLYGRTDERGGVRLGPLLSNSGLMQARAAGHVPKAMAFPPEQSPPGGDTEAEMAADELVIRLDQAGVISGRVVDARGFPVAGAVVEAVGSGRDKMPYSVTFDSSAVSDAHFDWAEDWSMDSSRVLIPAGELGVMLGPVPPIPLGDVDTREGGQLTTDDRGYFKINGVPPGQGVVLVRHPEYMDGKSATLSVAPGASVETEIVLRQGQALAGRVVDHRGFPVAFAGIIATARSFERRTLTESDGSFEFSAAPKKVSLRVNSPDNPLHVLVVHEVGDAERERKILIELSPPRDDVHLVVEDSRGEAISLAQVTLSSLDRRTPIRKTRFTHDDGSVDFEGLSGLEVRIEVDATGFVARKFDRRLSTSEKVVLDESLRVTGKVTGVRGRHVAAGATLVFKQGAFEKRATADELGEYELVGLPPGRGELSGSHPDYGQASRTVTITRGVGDRPAELPALDLSPALVIEGWVRDRSGRGIEGVLLSDERIGAYLTRRSSGAILGESGASGEFSVEVERRDTVYLFGARPGEAFGFSDAIVPGDLDRVRDVIIPIDHLDQAVAYEQGTVLITLQERGDHLRIYAVANGSQAEHAGLRAEDRLVLIDDIRPDGIDDARKLLSGPMGGQLRVVILRDGVEKTFLLHREAYAR